MFEAFYNQVSAIIEQACETDYRLVNEALVKSNWELGKLIVEEVLNERLSRIFTYVYGHYRTLIQ